MQLQDDLVYMLDPAAWARDVFCIVLDPWQKRVLRSEARQLLLNCSRQSGKSTVASIKAAHFAIYRPGSLVLMVSPSLRQSSELYRKTTNTLVSLTSSLSYEEETKTGLQLANGSRIVSLPGSEKTIRGFSAVDLLLEDEAARVTDDTYHAIRPMLATSGGAHILMSTPFGKRGHFYEAWEHGGDGWERYEVPATDCARISPEFLASERATMGEAWFQSEYLCQFVDTELSVFAAADIERAFTSAGAMPALFGGR